MVASGEREPSKGFVNKLKELYYGFGDSVNENECINLTFNQGVTGSSPVRPTLC